MSSPKGWTTSTKKLPALLLQSKKMKGYTLQQNCCTSSSRSHSFSHTITKIVYNTKEYHTQDRVTMIYFIGEIPWVNTTVNPIPWVCKTIGQHTSQKNFLGALPRTPWQGERVYSIPRLQSQLNNISGSRILGSTTNNLPLRDRSQQLHCYCTCQTMICTLDLENLLFSPSCLKVNINQEGTQFLSGYSLFQHVCRILASMYLFQF